MNLITHILFIHNFVTYRHSNDVPLKDFKNVYLCVYKYNYPINGESNFYSESKRRGW